MLDTDQQRHGFSHNTLRSIRTTRSYRDPQNRYHVLCKVDPDASGGGDEKEMSAIFIHATGSNLLEGRARSNKLPFWMTAGFGYYIEHLLTRSCRVYYVDFEEYYQNNQDAEIVRGGALGPDKPWPGAVKALCKKDVRESLEEVCSADIITLSPNESGYIFALTHFLVSTEDRVANYRRLVAAAREGKEVTKELLLITYGYEDDAALEADWYDYLESSKFK